MNPSPSRADPDQDPADSTDASSSAFTSSTLTFLFTDIEGSTARWDTQREAMAAALLRHDLLLRSAIEDRGGTVFKTVGDAFCAVFTGAEAALGAALDGQRALAAEDWRAFGTGAGTGGSRSEAGSTTGAHGAADFADLRVRMGIHHGKAESRGGDYFGPALNRTARLMSAGHGGQVLLSRTARKLLADRLPTGCRLRDLGEHRLKDLRHSEQIYQLVAEGLPDIAKAPQTAGELGARDRIVVTDPDAAGDPAEIGAALVVERTVAETLAELLAVIRGDARALVLTVPQVRAAAQYKPADLTEYRLGRIAEWSQPRYRLDGRFVALTLLVDQGEETSGERWVAKAASYDDLGALVAAMPDPALVLLGPPGGGKSTLLRRLELDTAIANLRGEDARDTVTFFIQLNQYKARVGHPLPDPGDWLAAEWAERYPDLPPLDALLCEGRMVLLLDALNEMPAASERESRQQLGLWKDWLQRLAQTRPGNRVVFSCRSLDYSAPLSTPALRVPQVQIEPLSDAQVSSFLTAYSPLRGAEIWAAIRGTPQLEALRSPFFLALLVDQVEATGELAEDRAGLFTGFVRQALRREVERDNPLFALDALLSSRDVRRVAQWQWKDAFELPERGSLFPKLGALAYGMQEGAEGGAASQVRLDLDEALDLLEDPQDEAIVKAGLAIAVLDEDPAADALLYRHQLIQEYFAARILARNPRPELVATPWRAAEIHPGVPELLATLPASETLPPLPQTGWEETTLLAAAMTADKDGFVRGLVAGSLALAGRAAQLPAVRSQLSAGLLDELRLALVARSRDVEADLRHRIACATAVGALGDPRWERRVGPFGEYLLPPFVAIPGGKYPIGEDEPITWDSRGTSGTSWAHVPRHEVTLAPFQIAHFPVTNAEFVCFMAAGGYQDERWWETEDARRWLHGEIANEAGKLNNRVFRSRLLTQEGLFEQMEAEGGFPNDEARERWKSWVLLDDEAFEAALAERWKGQPQTEPAFWQDGRFNEPMQPVVGVCWYEAQAYCAWLAAQSEVAVRLPTEVEWEAAARGDKGRMYAYGPQFNPAWANTHETRLRRTTPVGVFVEGDTPEGVSDKSGNVQEWTLSLWGEDDDFESEVPEFAYPYHADDGREDPAAPPSAARVVRGGSWFFDLVYARSSYRLWVLPGGRDSVFGFRLVVSSPISPEPLAAGAA